MAVGAHAHEGGQLDEAGVDTPPRAGEARRDLRDDVLLEPRQRVLHRQAVHPRRVDPAVDGPRHERQAPRPRGVVVLGHERCGGERLHAGLADGDHVRAGAHDPEELDEVLGVAVQPERARRHGDLAGVVPVREVDVVLGEHRPHGRAQERREVPGHRRDEQHGGLRDGGVLREVQQRGERRDVLGNLGHGDLGSGDDRGVDAERGARVAEAGERDDLGRRRGAADERELRHAAGQVTDRVRQDGRRDPEGRHEIRLGLVGRVEHSSGTLISVVDRPPGHL